MFLKDSGSGDLAQVVKLGELTDPNLTRVTVRFHAGEELGDPTSIEKEKLVFPSGEVLPKCWLDPHYRVSF